MRLILLSLTVLLMLIQFPLWLGKGGWLKVWDMDQQVYAAQRKNDELRERNRKLASEVQDLKDGSGAIEERARYELGMIKDNEIFVQILDPNTSPPLQEVAAPVKPEPKGRAAPKGKPAQPPHKKPQ